MDSGSSPRIPLEEMTYFGKLTSIFTLQKNFAYFIDKLKWLRYDIEKEALEAAKSRENGTFFPFYGISGFYR